MPPHLVFNRKAGNLQARHLRVLVHGYLSATDERDRDRLLELIPPPGPDEDVLLASWDSGNLQEMLVRSLKGAASGFVGFNKLTLARSALFAVKGGVEHFQGKKDKARQVGETLFAELQQELAHYPRLEQISLYGHSLGARVVVEALLGLREPPPMPLQDVVLMATARRISDEETGQMLACIHGRLVNCYSRADKVLLAKPGPHKWAGRHPLPEPPGCARVLNIRLDIGHTQYWSLLAGIFAKVADPGYAIELPQPAPSLANRVSGRLHSLRKGKANSQDLS